MTGFFLRGIVSSEPAITRPDRHHRYRQINQLDPTPAVSMPVICKLMDGGHGGDGRDSVPECHHRRYCNEEYLINGFASDEIDCASCLGHHWYIFKVALCGFHFVIALPK